MSDRSHCPSTDPLERVHHGCFGEPGHGDGHWANWAGDRVVWYDERPAAFTALNHALTFAVEESRQASRVRRHATISREHATSAGVWARNAQRIADFLQQSS